MRPVIYTATAADVAAGFTPPIPVDYLRDNGQYGLQYQTAAQGVGTGTVQTSLDSPFTPPSGGMTWSTVAVTNGRAFLNQVASAFRILNPVLGDVLTVIAQGASPAT